MAALQTILDRANALTQEAVDFDQNGDLARAIAKYDDATHLLVLVAQRSVTDEADEEKVIATVGQIEAIRGRIATLKAALADFEARLSESQKGNPGFNSNSNQTPIKGPSSAPTEASEKEEKEKGREKEERKESEAEEKEGPKSAPLNSEELKSDNNISTEKDYPPTKDDYETAESPNISKPPEDEEWLERMVLSGVVVYEVFDANKTRRTLLDGTQPLEVLVRESTLVLLSSEGEFSYELTSALPCLSLHEPNGRVYLILPSLQRQQFYALLLPTTMKASEIEAFERLLAQFSTFQLQLRGAPASASGEQPSVTHPVDIDEDWEVVDPSVQSESALALIPTQEEAQKTITSQKISSVATGIETGGEFIAKGIIAGGELLNSTIKKGSAKLKEQVTPNETATEVPEAVKDTLKKAKELSPHAVKLSAAVSDGLSYIAGEIAVSLAKGIKQATSSGSGEGNSFFNDPRVKAAGNVGMAGLGAFGSIFAALEKAAMTVIEGTSEATADVLEHKFGEEVGSAARDGFAVGVDAVKTVHNVTALKPKKIARAIALHSAKEAGKAYIGIEDKKRPIAMIGEGSAVSVDAVDSDEESERRLYAALTQSTTAEDRDSLPSLPSTETYAGVSPNLVALVSSSTSEPNAAPTSSPSPSLSLPPSSASTVSVSSDPLPASATQMPTVTDAD